MTRWRRRSRLLAAGAFACTLGCAPLRPSQPTAPQCDAGDHPLVRDTLYFGRNRPTGGPISDADWQDFLTTTVTPRFPAGLTVVQATGQWRGASGTVERERAEIVTILHAGDPSQRAAITEVVSEYKRRFGQEAVLRERTPTCARF